MIKIAFMGVYREPSGTGTATRNYLKAFIRSGAKVAARPIFFSAEVAEGDEEIRKAESLMLGEYDAVVVACPPYSYEVVDASVPHTGIFFTETNPLPASWSSYCELMDSIIHPSHDQQKWCKTTNFPFSSVVPVPTDINKYFKSYKKSKLVDTSLFNFYTISDFSHRKNFSGLLRAYFYEFKAHEQVCLTIKTNGDLNVAKNFVAETAAKANLSEFPNVNIITDKLTDEEILQLHKSSDCYVSASYGEGWNLPAQDALLFGKTPIVGCYGGQKDFINNENGWVVHVTEEPCYNGGTVHFELFTGKRLWGSPDLLELASCMRSAVSDTALRESKGFVGMESAEQFSFEVVGKQLLGVLHDASEKNRQKDVPSRASYPRDPV